MSIRGRITYECDQPHCHGVKEAIERANALAALLSASQPSAPVSSWECGCGTVNGVNLSECGICKRHRSETKFAPQPSAESMDDWRPTAAHINALPEPVRSFIHQLETHVVDPAGDVAQLVLGKDTIRQLEAALAESEAEVTALHAERDRLKAELVMAHRFRLEDAADHCEGQILEVDRRKRAEAEAARLRAALEDCRDYLKGRAPVLEGMALLTTVNAALASSGTVPSQAERKQLAESIAARIAGSSSGTALRENIIESLLTFPAVTKTVSMLASGTVQDRLNKGQN